MKTFVNAASCADQAVSGYVILVCTDVRVVKFTVSVCAYRGQKGRGYVCVGAYRGQRVQWACEYRCLSVQRVALGI